MRPYLLIIYFIALRTWAYLKTLFTQTLFELLHSLIKNINLTLLSSNFFAVS